MSISIDIILVTAALFIATRLIGGVLGEYGKRIWFAHFEPFFLRLTRKIFPWIALKERVEALDSATIGVEQEFQEMRALIIRTISERDAYHAETIQLKVLLNCPPKAGGAARPD